MQLTDEKFAPQQPFVTQGGLPPRTLRAWSSVLDQRKSDAGTATAELVSVERCSAAAALIFKQRSSETSSEVAVDNGR